MDKRRERTLYGWICACREYWREYQYGNQKVREYFF
jgi:hypothetical protein